MKKNNMIIAAAVVVLAGAAAGYFYWQQSQPLPAPEPVKVKPKALPPPPPAPAPQPEVKPVVQAPTQPPLPKLGESDKFVLDMFAGLVGNKSLMGLFHTDKVVRNIVATIDNLPRERAPIKVMPLKPASGAFITAGDEENLTIDPKNAARYAPYMKLAQVVDSKKLAEVYVRLYPLFQQAYEGLGYPKGYFNDRLMDAIDDMLEAPDIKGPVKLVQPNVMYQYADPDLESSSAGQKIIMRIGSSNEAKIKAKLREIKQEIALHVRDGKIVSQ